MKSKEKKVPQIQLRCIYCGNTPVDRQHVLPKWMKKIIGSKEKSYANSLIAKNYSGNQVSIVPTLKTRQGDYLDRTVKIACSKNCNSGWMSRLENDCKNLLTDLIQGTPVQLNQIDQSQLAKWLVMTCISSAYSFPEKNGISRDEIKYFFATKTVPENWRMWIGSYYSIEMSVRPLQRSFSLLRRREMESSAEELAKSRPNSQIMSMGLGTLYALVVSVPIEFMDVFSIDEYGYKLKQLWPVVEEGILLPYTDKIGNKDLEFLAFKLRNEQPN